MDLNTKRLAALAEVKALRARVAKLGKPLGKPTFFNTRNLQSHSRNWWTPNTPLFVLNFCINGTWHLLASGYIISCRADAKVAALEKDANGGRKASFDGPGQALHEEPGVYIPQASIRSLFCALHAVSWLPSNAKADYFFRQYPHSVVLALGFYSAAGTQHHDHIPDRMESCISPLQR